MAFEELSSRLPREPTGSTSASLVARLKSHDPGAWERLVDLYGPLIYHWARRAGLSAEDAADRVQEVLSSAWSGIDRFRHDRTEDTLRGWLRTITRNRILDHFRSHASEPEARGGTAAYRRMEQVHGPSPPSTSIDPAALEGFADLVHRALDAVRPDFSDAVWRAFVLIALEHRTAAEAGSELGMTANAARQAKFRVLQRLRAELGDVA